jgi:uncharacterized protein
MGHHLDIAGPIDVESPDPAGVVDGVPTIGFRRLAEFPSSKIGVWEMTPGAVAEVEVDEVCLILSGSATVRFEDGQSLSLRPGSAIRLNRGEKTTWVVHATLRKIYIC